ncbi:MAG: DALR anticodon-binding domain-containing protein, partial [Dongiaceae bacterium]
LVKKYGDSLKNKAEEEWFPLVRPFVINAMMDEIKNDLALLGVKHDVFTSELAMLESGAVDKMMEQLEKKDLIYVGVLEPPKGKAPDDWEPRPQTLFKASQFGDDIDRPLKKADGSYTYFAKDIAYHYDKYKRGSDTLIDILGADHGGYVKRMAAAVKAFSDGKCGFDAKVCQLIKLTKDGEPVKMSKRAGTFVTLQEVIQEVGKDVFRFIIMTRKNDMPMDFDLAKAVEQSKDNPVFYVQYAHARTHSVLRHAAEMFKGEDLSINALANADLSLLKDPEELALLKTMASWPRQVELAVEAHEPHRLAFFLSELAACFHALWNKGNENTQLRFLIEGNKPLSLARLALIQGMALVIASGLRIFGVQPLQEM